MINVAVLSVFTLFLGRSFADSSNWSPNYANVDTFIYSNDSILADTFFGTYKNCLQVNSSFQPAVFSTLSSFNSLTNSLKFDSSFSFWVGGFSYFTNATSAAAAYWPLAKLAYAADTPLPSGPSTRCIAMLWNGTAQWTTPPQNNPNSQLSCMQNLRPLCQNNSNRNYYFVLPDSCSFFDAYRRCAAIGAQLAEITSTSPGLTLSDVVRSTIANTTNTASVSVPLYLWLSIFNPYSATGEVGVSQSNPFYFVDGSQLSSDVVAKVGSNLQSAACATIAPRSSAQTGISLLMDNTSSCNRPGIGTLCRRSTYSSCIGQTNINNACYFYYAPALSYDQALRTCSSKTPAQAMPTLSQIVNDLQLILSDNTLSVGAFWLNGFSYSSSNNNGAPNFFQITYGSDPVPVTTSTLNQLTQTSLPTSRCVALKVTVSCNSGCSVSAAWASPPSTDTPTLSCLQNLKSIVRTDTFFGSCGLATQVGSKCYYVSWFPSTWILAVQNKLLDPAFAKSVATALFGSYSAGTYYFWTSLVNYGAAVETSDSNSFYGGDSTRLSANDLQNLQNLAGPAGIDFNGGACGAISKATYTSSSPTWIADISNPPCSGTAKTLCPFSRFLALTTSKALKVNQSISNVCTISDNCNLN